NASSKKANAENFITKFAHYYTPIVVTIAILIAVLPPLLLAEATFVDYVYRACIFLVVSCPCALVISVPLSFFGGIGGASKQGILLKGGNYLEALAHVSTIVFDKTGTLTEGQFEVQKICANNISEAELLEMTALLESFSHHPIARSIVTAYGKDIDQNKIIDMKEIAGYGLAGNYQGKELLAGNQKLMCQHHIELPEINEIGTLVYVGYDHQYVGYFVIRDRLKEGSKETIQALQKQQIHTVMLTGDQKGVAQMVADEMGIETVYSELLPQDKVSRLEEMMQQKQKKEVIAFVGDGMNDAPVLARADIGIAMGQSGSDAAIEVADVVIMKDDIRKLLVAQKIANKTLSIVKQNIVFALGVKILIMILGAFGEATMWEAVFADVGVAVIAILNATRALKSE
ncbi:MAG: heavy metal translocating P-type ATPase, partial [Erysipelotrichaceae bacterium]|nr:heavy metal translocating P-type ATPase [Erysipelotrichaceae bacterium]